MSDEVKLDGILPAIASPCDENDNFLEDAFASLVEHLYKVNINGLYVCGNTGQGLKMKLPERKRAAQIAVELSKPHKGTVIVHVGAAKTKDALTLAEHAAETGATAVSSLPPKCSHKHLLNYYRDLAETAGLPTMIYHAPILTDLESTLDEIIELLDIPGVVGLKYTDWNLFFMKRILLTRPQTIVFNGFDEFLSPGLAYGAHGGIGTWYNVFPELFVSIYKAFKKGNIGRAIELQQVMLNFADIAWRNDRGAIFEHLMCRKGFGPRCRREPRTEMTEDQIKTLEPELNKAIADIHEAILG